VGLTYNLDRLDTLIGPVLHAGRVPGAALAVVIEGRIAFVQSYGYRDLAASLPMTSDTLYPIASTTKAISATLLGMLVDANLLAWDEPVQSYLPGFRLSDQLHSAQVTLRDLVIMRTGLPRHDWLWIDHPIDRAGLVRRLRHLEHSAGFRERFQYNNLTVTAAGHIAEIVTGSSWETLIRERILEPLGMRASTCNVLAGQSMSLSYHETTAGELIPTVRLATEVGAPSGGALHSSVEEMARWVAFNLGGGKVDGRQLIEPRTLQEIHSPQIAVGADPSAPTAGAMYGMGWFVDRYRSCLRISHGGYLHDVNSEVTLFPYEHIGIVSTTNFGCPRLARLINQHAFDLLMGFAPLQTVEQKMAEYQQSIAETRGRNTAAPRVLGTQPSHPLDEYAGVFAHAAYGSVEVLRSGDDLSLRRAALRVRLQHWHYDSWYAEDDELFAPNESHPFDRANRVSFETDVDGVVSAILLRLEPAVAPIRFARIR
jgi:CubicO group peptidase (beta-lactamase class C family)